MVAPEGVKLGGKLKELGRGGLRQYSGVINEDPDPEFNGGRWRRTCARMMEDPVLGAGLSTVKLLIRNAPRAVAPADQSKKAIAAAALIESSLDDMSHSFGEFIGEACSMNGFGWAYFETCYKERRGPRPLRRRRADGKYMTPPASNHNDGAIGWRKFALRPQDTLVRWEFDDTGGIQGMYQSAAPNYKPVLIPIWKSLLFRPEAYKNNPEGRSLLKSAWRPWYIGRNVEQIEAMGLERDLNGTPLFEVPAAWLEEEADQNHKDAVKSLEEIGENVRNDATSYIMIPQLWDAKGNKQILFSLVASQGKRAYDTGAIVARYDHRKLLALLAQFLLMGSEKVGSYALSATQSDIFVEFLNSLSASIADVINRFAIPRLLDLNGIDLKYAPKLKFGQVKKINLPELGEFIQRLAQAGMRLFPSKSNENHMYDMAGIPIPPDDDRPDPAEAGIVGGAQGDGSASNMPAPDGNQSKPKPKPKPQQSGDDDTVLVAAPTVSLIDDDEDEAEEPELPDGIVEYEVEYA